MSKSNNKSATFKPNRDLVQAVQTRVITLLGRKNGEWLGSMSELSAAITTGIRRAIPTDWPKTPSVLRMVVNAAVPSLRRAGVRVEFGRTTDHGRKRFAHFYQA